MHGTDLRSVYSNNTWRNGAAQHRSPAVHPSSLTKTGGPSRCSSSSPSSSFPLLCCPFFASSPPLPPLHPHLLSATSCGLADSLKQLLQFLQFGVPAPGMGRVPVVWAGTCGPRYAPTHTYFIGSMCDTLEHMQTITYNNIYI